MPKENFDENVDEVVPPTSQQEIVRPIKAPRVQKESKNAKKNKTLATKNRINKRRMHNKMAKRARRRNRKNGSK